MTAHFASGVDPSTLPPALLRYFGGPNDIFIVRLLKQPKEKAISECRWRATGNWDANNREGWAAYHALRDEIEGAPERNIGWGQTDYLDFRANKPMR
jgi:hypothetical protein